MHAAEQKAGTDGKSAFTPKDEFVCHDKMKQELSLLQQKIMSLESKLKQSSCIGLDSRTLTAVPTAKKADVVPEQPSSHIIRERPNPCNRSVSSVRGTQTPMVHSKAYCNESPKSQCHTHTNSVSKPQHSFSVARASVTSLPSGPIRSTPSKLLAKRSGTAARKSRVDTTITKSVRKERSRMEDKENIRAQPSHIKRGPVKPAAADLAKKDSDNWRRKYEKLKEKNEKLAEDYEELLENYKASEEVRKQQRRRIRELEKQQHVKPSASIEAVASSTSCGFSVNVRKKVHKK